MTIIERLEQLIEEIEPYTEDHTSFLGYRYYRGRIGAFKECIKLIKEERRKASETDKDNGQGEG